VFFVDGEPTTVHGSPTESAANGRQFRRFLRRALSVARDHRATVSAEGRAGRSAAKDRPLCPFLMRTRRDRENWTSGEGTRERRTAEVGRRINRKKAKNVTKRKLSYDP